MIRSRVSGKSRMRRPSARANALPMAPPVGPTGAAIGNALAPALGRRIRDLPLTRERIMATLLAE